jgi:hypothetical protein
VKKQIQDVKDAQAARELKAAQDKAEKEVTPF